MRGLGHFIALLFIPMAFGVDFNVDPGSSNAHPLYAKSPVSLRSLLGTGSDADFSRVHHRIQKRSTDGGSDSCNGLEGYESKLTSNTHNVSSFEAPMQPYNLWGLSLTNLDSTPAWHFLRYKTTTSYLFYERLLTLNSKHLFIVSNSILTSIFLDYINSMQSLYWAILDNLLINK